MGGYGSTRWGLHDKKATVDNSIRLSVKDIMRAIPKPIIEAQHSWDSMLSWRRADVTTYVMKYALEWSETDTPYLILSYSPRFVNGVAHWKNETVDLQFTPCAYGGRRYWFTCPRCDRRAGCLYISPRDSRWACRICHKLTYKSAQTAHEGDRGMLAGLGRAVDLLLRAEKLEKRMNKHRPGSKAWWRVYHKYAGLVDTVSRQRAASDADLWRARVSK